MAKPSSFIILLLLAAGIALVLNYSNLIQLATLSVPCTRIGSPVVTSRCSYDSSGVARTTTVACPQNLTSSDANACEIMAWTCQSGQLSRECPFTNPNLCGAYNKGSQVSWSYGAGDFAFGYYEVRCLAPDIQPVTVSTTVTQVSPYPYIPSYVYLVIVGLFVLAIGLFFIGKRM